MPTLQFTFSLSLFLGLDGPSTYCLSMICCSIACVSSVLLIMSHIAVPMESFLSSSGLRGLGLMFYFHAPDTSH